MSYKSMGNPFDPNRKLTHSLDCSCADCRVLKQGGASSDRDYTRQLEQYLEKNEVSTTPGSSVPDQDGPRTQEEMMDRMVESAVVRGISAITTCSVDAS